MVANVVSYLFGHGHCDALRICSVTCGMNGVCVEVQSLEETVETRILPVWLMVTVMEDISSSAATACSQTHKERNVHGDGFPEKKANDKTAITPKFKYLR